MRDVVPAFRWRYHYLLLLPLYVVFVVLLVRHLGLDNMESLPAGNWQFLDLDLLKEKPFASLLYLHSQPPLLNLVAWVLEILPGSLYSNFIWLNASCMALVGYFLYLFSCRFVPPAWALGVSAAYLVSPAVLLNIGCPFYPCLTTFGYSLLLLAFHLAPSRKGWALASILFAIFYLSMLRSSFTILHVLLFVGLYIWMNRRTLKTREACWLVVLSLAFSSVVPFKNLLLYGFFSSSSWTPMNIARGAVVEGPFDYFPQPEEIRAHYPGVTCEKSYGVQDVEDRKRNGLPNYNSCIFLEHVKIARSYLVSGYSLSRHLTQIGHNVAKYLSPPDRYRYLLNREFLLGYSDWVDRYVFASVVWPKSNALRLAVVALGVLASIVYQRQRNAFLGFCLMVVAEHFFSHVLTDGIESERFVFDIEFIFFILFSASVGYARNRFVKSAPSGHSQPLQGVRQ